VNLTRAFLSLMATDVAMTRSPRSRFCVRHTERISLVKEARLRGWPAKGAVTLRDALVGAVEAQSLAVNFEQAFRGAQYSPLPRMRSPNLLEFILPPRASRMRLMTRLASSATFRASAPQIRRDAAG